MTNRHPYCESNPRGWFGHNHTIENPAVVTLDYDYFPPGNAGQYIPAGTKHLQWETLNFGWWKWMDDQGNVHLLKY